MTGAVEQYHYNLRNEFMHCNSGIDLINYLMLENPQRSTARFTSEIRALFETAAGLEYRYAEDTMPTGELCVNS